MCIVKSRRFDFAWGPFRSLEAATLFAERADGVVFPLFTATASQWERHVEEGTPHHRLRMPKNDPRCKRCNYTLTRSGRCLRCDRLSQDERDHVTEGVLP